MVPSRRGAVIIPAYNEAAIIKRVLAPLSRIAVDGSIELIVVCNGCVDRTAELAREIPGVQVVELQQGFKPAALNIGDDVASVWPRLYLDADAQISADAVIAVLDRVSRGDVLVASPRSAYDSIGSSRIVRGYFRARHRISLHAFAVWQAGAYALSEVGHARFGCFPAVTGDDFFVDSQFHASEKAIVETAMTVRKTPKTAKDLLAVMRRHRRGNVEIMSSAHKSDDRLQDTSLQTALAVASTVRGPLSAADAFVYLTLSLYARSGYRKSVIWERDESSREPDC